jgi:hypothetical protein
LQSVEHAQIPDPYDFVDNPDGLVLRKGVIVRTDFTNDEAWNAVVQIINESEKSGAAELSQIADATPDEAGESGSESESEDEEGDTEMAGSSALKEDDAIAFDSSFIIYDPPADQRSLFTNASNLRLVRIFNDVDIIGNPPPSKSQKRTAAGVNKLVDFDGFHEVYDDRLIWVYDSSSNSEGSLRLVIPRVGIAT